MATVLVTAATKNTGLAIAEKFASEGFSVAVTSRNKEESEKTAKKLTEKYNINAKGYKLELLDVEQIRSVFAEVRKDFGGLDTFVANAANLGVDIDMLSVDEEEYEAVVDANLKGSFFCAQQAALIMKEQRKGSIVFISSVHSHECIWGRSLYTASKGGINALARAMAIELGPLGIRTNCIIAGAIKTDRWNSLTPEQIAKKRANWPVGLESTGEDIANGVFYLGTDLSKTVSGTELTIDSGILVSLLPFNGGKH
ncbi:MAG: SDR family oxidoreductase [Clostridia bacterium]|jgi:NAD(P)-dependent dehydrogenase (short-subunit alcohol dehydrogenase family)|nr:SDR family oxidoreductase [Clostridia bacterium]